MQNGSDGLLTLFRLTVEEVRRNSNDGKATRERVLFSLLAAARQAVTRRQYSYALQCKMLYATINGHERLRSAWDELEQTSAHGVASTSNTPASNTGVTDSGAAVPCEYFTGVK
jgi:hypothetical protein